MKPLKHACTPSKSWTFRRLMMYEHLADLRAQHDAFSRTGYDGHNRRPMKLTMHALAVRRRRRRMNRICRTMYQD